MTENLAPVSGTSHLTSDVMHFSKTNLPSLPPQPQTCEQQSEEVAAGFFLFLHLITLQPSPNKTFFDQT